MEPYHTSPAEHPTHALPSPADAQRIAASKEKHRRLFQRGMKCMGVGLLLMVVSFGVNLLLFHSNADFATAMYVLTSLGAAFIVAGLVCFFGF